MKTIVKSTIRKYSLEAVEEEVRFLKGVIERGAKLDIHIVTKEDRGVLCWDITTEQEL